MVHVHCAGQDGACAGRRQRPINQRRAASSAACSRAPGSKSRPSMAWSTAPASPGRARAARASACSRRVAARRSPGEVRPMLVTVSSSSCQRLVLARSWQRARWRLAAASGRRATSRRHRAASRRTFAAGRSARSWASRAARSRRSEVTRPAIPGARVRSPAVKRRVSPRAVTISTRTSGDGRATTTRSRGLPSTGSRRMRTLASEETEGRRGVGWDMACGIPRRRSRLAETDATAVPSANGARPRKAGRWNGHPLPTW